MSIDPSKLSIISSQKANEDRLSKVGDSKTELLPSSVQQERSNTKKCNVCCMLYGGLINSVCVIVMGVAITMVSIKIEHRVQYSMNGLMRQMCWISFPGLLVGLTLHYLLSEAMWSGKHNSWGQAWAKALVMNGVLWSGGIGVGTLAWRKLLPLTPAGRRIYHRYPIPSDPLETRVLRSDKQMLTGMGFTYWLSGVATGSLGMISCVGFSSYTNRPYMMMVPDGSYSKYCMPPWRRDHMAALASQQGN